MRDPTVTGDTALALVHRRCAGCEMPPDDTPLPADERVRLLGWGACAPEKSP